MFRIGSSNAVTSNAAISETGIFNPFIESEDGLQIERQAKLQTISGSVYVALLPTVSIDSLPAAAEDRRCALCLTIYKSDNEEPVMLPCSHIYDRECINEWLSEKKTAKNTCPICRTSLFEQDESLSVRLLQDNEDDANFAASLVYGETELDRFEREFEEDLAVAFDVYTAGGVREDFELYDELRFEGASLPQRNMLQNVLELSIQEELILFAELYKREELILRMVHNDRTNWLARHGDESFSLRNISGTLAHDDNALVCQVAARNLLREAFRSGADLNRYENIIDGFLDLFER